jgi:hypothetical protein
MVARTLPEREIAGNDAWCHCLAEMPPKQRQMIKI